MKRLVDRIPTRLRNRYALAVGVFLAWITVVDSNDVWTTWKNSRELRAMRKQHAWYANEIERTREQLHELSSNKELLEKFARERYLMKRENEEIFVLVPEQ
mgnify:FL=1|jgi:cell division protein DivIC